MRRPRANPPCLQSPGFPDEATAVPVDIEYMRSLLDQDHWDSRPRTLGDLRPPPAKRVSFKVSPNKWQIAEPSATALLMLPPAASLVVDRLIGLNLADRTIYGQEAIKDKQEALLSEDAGDKKAVDAAIAASDLCESEQEPTKYTVQLDVLVDCLKKLLEIQEKRIDLMTTLEKLGVNMDGESSMHARIILTSI